MVFHDRFYDIFYILWIMLSVSIHCNNNIGAEQFGGLNAGFGGCTFPAVDFVAKSGDVGNFFGFL